ncbi:3-alpha--hydroxysteroid dehydrogenase [Geopyxis carbonaria]|nr:3-alpha--hydroxysteroid dehydrogenase [Geopyxis carbonaria]
MSSYTGSTGTGSTGSEFSDMEAPPKRVVIITGSTTGIGLAIAKHLLAGGWTVVLSNLPQLHEETLIRSLGPNASFFPCDVTKAEQVKILVNTIYQQNGVIDGFVCNAGICVPTPGNGQLHLDSPENFQRHWDVNVMGMLHCIQAVAPLMAKQGGGAIVNICSVAGMRGTKGIAAYTTSKWAVQGLTRTAAADYGESNVRVNAVAPGLIETKMMQAVLGSVGGREGAAAAAKLGRIGQPEEVAVAVEFLLTSTFTSGTILPVDGGFMS